MESIIDKIQNNIDITTKQPCSNEDIATRLILLQATNFAPPPLEYLQFIKKINGLRSFDACIYGCYEKSNSNFIDFLDKNILLDRSDKMSIITLGENTMDYLVYNKNNENYETRDLKTDQITFTFKTLKDALSYFLALDNKE